jgi:putative transposase
MPRNRRILPDNCVQHVINRGNKREVVFRQTADYEDFFCLLADAMDRVPMRILSVTLMENHFHLVLWPTEGILVSAYMDWLMNAQIRRLQKRHGTIGSGHVYQGRFKNFPVQGDVHLYRVLRYVEANPLRASLVQRAEKYRWSSLSRRRTPDGREYLSEWPVPCPDNWMDYVNEGIDWRELDTLRTSTNRGTPFGDKLWVQTTAERYGLETTLTPRGRPKKTARAAQKAPVAVF